MNVIEKSVATLALIATVAILVSLFMFAELRSLKPLLLTCSAGFVINIGLMFVVLRDIFLRRFPTNHTRYFWIAMVLICWPTILYYLPRYGFKPR